MKGLKWLAGWTVDKVEKRIIGKHGVTSENYMCDAINCFNASDGMTVENKYFK